MSDNNAGFKALGHKVTQFERLETFPAPENSVVVKLTSDDPAALIAGSALPAQTWAELAPKPKAKPAAKKRAAIVGKGDAKKSGAAGRKGPAKKG